MNEREKKTDPWLEFALSLNDKLAIVMSASPFRASLQQWIVAAAMEAAEASAIAADDDPAESHAHRGIVSFTSDAASGPIDSAGGEIRRGLLSVAHSAPARGSTP